MGDAAFILQHREERPLPRVLRCIPNSTDGAQMQALDRDETSGVKRKDATPRGFAIAV